MYWEPELEQLERKDLEGLQLKRLNGTLRQAARSPYYGRSKEVSRLVQSGVSSVEQIRELPFTTKNDMRNEFPWGLLAADKREEVRLHSSSGTTGNPAVVYHSRHDLDSWANLMARSMFAAGVRDSDVFQNICGYGLFTTVSGSNMAPKSSAV